LDKLVGLAVAASVATVSYFFFAAFARYMTPHLRDSFRYRSRRGIQNKDADEYAHDHLRVWKALMLLVILASLSLYAVEILRG